MTFTQPEISIAEANDAVALTPLLNEAYRGESSKNGWTTEAHLISGEVRTTIEQIQTIMQQPGCVFLKLTQENSIVACVNLQVHDHRLYLGMLAVQPGLQNGGIGKKMLQAADEFARAKNCTAVYMTVISLRAELISWYQRHGYCDTGLRKPFEEDGASGKHLQPLNFVVLEKIID